MPLTIGLGPAFAGGGGGASGEQQGQTIFGLDFVATSASARVNDKTITEFPMVNTSMVTSMDSMFSSCKSLQSIPLLDTSKVTSMNYMFQGCESLREIPLLDTSNANSASSMFSSCYNLEYVPDFNFGKVPSLNYMFRDCKKLKSAVFSCDTIATSMAYLFKGCHALETISLDVNKVEGASYAFSECYNLKNCMLRNLKASISFSDSPLLSKESVLYLFENAQTVTSSKTITFHADVFAQLTDDEIAIATEKGFSVVSA